MSLDSVSDEPDLLEQAPDPRQLDRRLCALQFERARLRAMRAVELSRATPGPGRLDEIDAALPGIESRLASTRREGGATLREQRLKEWLGLGDVELDFAWTAVALAGDPRVMPHAQVLAGNDATRGASPALHALLAALDGEAAATLAMRLSPMHPLARHGLLVPDRIAALPSARTWAAPPRLGAWLAGRDEVDEEVAAAGGLVEIPGGIVVDEAQAATQDRLMRALAMPEPALLVVEGPPGTGRRVAVAEPAARLGLHVMSLDVRRVGQSPEALESALLALRRECFLYGAVMLVTGVEAPSAESQEGRARLRAIAAAADRAAGHAVLVTGSGGVDLGGLVERRPQRFRWGLPDGKTRVRLWQRALAGGVGDTRDLDLVAQRYQMGATAIARSVATAQVVAESALDERRAPLTTAELIAGVRSGIAEQLAGLAQHITVEQTWDDLVLGTETADQITALMARVALAHEVYERWGFRRKLPRGMGVAALFSGPPGTGKTMVAGLIARELDLELYQVDLSKVLSKWIGETEKQLARIFDAAEAGHALLLFDEADSLFARRTEVRTATDRYANLEVNFLLQRIESFGGVTILTTNLDSSIDPALRRRLGAHIVFWPPDEEERALLWSRMIPQEAPVAADVDPAHLARTYREMTGANIRNAVLAAAFLAANEGQPIGRKHLDRAAKAEYRAMGRLVA